MFCWIHLFLALPVYAIHVPIYSQPRLQRRAQIGLGDYLDVTYAVQINIGGVLTPLILDTGSSDLWVISSGCKSPECSTSLPLYPQEHFQATGLDVNLLYGDSRSGTHATGKIGVDNASFADLAVTKQYFASIDDTNTSVIATGATGIFGLGFPINSFIWTKMFKAQHQITARDLLDDEREFDFGKAPFPSLGSLYPPSSPKHQRKRHSSSQLKRTPFPSISSLYPTLSSRQTSAQSAWTQIILDSFGTASPLVSRLVLANSTSTNKLSDPTFTVSLQRNTVTSNPSETVGLVSIGEFPSGVTKDSFTWTGLRLYTPEEGGLYSPTSDPTQVYPITWEIPIEDVYLDGQVLPRSQLSPSSIGLSALIDTGNSLIRGPSDVTKAIRDRLKISSKGTFDCATPHTLAFKINGKMFPVDPRDFTSQAYDSSVKDCIPNVVSTDPPAEGKGYKYSWNLGTPFLKSVLASFHYGNITHPLSDPPRIGLVSTVPQDADQRLKDTVAQAGSGLLATSNPAPTGLPTGVPSPSVSVTAKTKDNGAQSLKQAPGSLLLISLAVLAGYWIL